MAATDPALEQKLLGELGKIDVVEICADLVRVQSHRESPGHETPCAKHIQALLAREGIPATLQDVRDGRCNVVGTLKGKGSGPALMFNGHIDTVPPGEMPAPFAPQVVNGKLTGRGTVDMKGGIAGQLAAMIALKRSGFPLAGDLIFTGVIAEEDSTSLGSLHVIEHGPRADMVVVSEPSALGAITAHKGFDYYRIDIEGRACHSSKPHAGISAVYKAAHIINAIESEFIARSCARKHSLLGPASLNVAAVLGYSNSEAVTALRRAPGDKPAGAVVPDICTIYLDRRRIPGETLEEVFADFETLIAEMSAKDPDLSARIGFTPACPELPTHPPLDTDPQHVLVRECARISANVAGTDGKPQGVPFWSDAALFNQFGKIPAIVFGPGDVGVAHSNHEFVPVEELTKGAQVFALLAASLVGAKN